jgi:hypothetical protein
MNDETKEILIDLVDYYCRMGTKIDPGISVLESVVQRASKALEREAAEQKLRGNRRSSDVDPFAMDVVGYRKMKHENDY